MTRETALKTALHYRTLARCSERYKATGDASAATTAYYYACARKYLRKARDLRPVRVLPNPELVQTT